MIYILILLLYLSEIMVAVQLTSVLIHRIAQMYHHCIVFVIKRKDFAKEESNTENRYSITIYSFDFGFKLKASFG